MNVRPRTLTPKMVLAAARKLVAEMVKDGLIDGDPEEHACDIAKHGREYMDGYQLAKALDSHCYWDCDFQMAEALDRFSCVAREEIEFAQRAWAERNATAPLSIGSLVKINTGETGKIVDLCKPAKYLVAIDGTTSDRRRVVNYEDAEILEALDESS